MADKTSKWLIGCGIGCGAVILLVIIVLGVGYLMVRNTVQNVREIEVTSDRLVEAYGDIREYVPPVDGIILPERIDTFLAVRDSMAPFREEMVRVLDDISDEVDGIERESRSFWNILGIVGKGIGIIPRMIEFYSVRNDALLASGMGPGEYVYLYVTAYYSFLRFDPADGPPFPMTGDEDTPPPWMRDEPETTEDEEMRAERRYRIIRQVNWIFRSFLVNQIEQLEDGTVGDIDTAWKRTLERELEALRDDRERLPWESGLPERIEAVFRPFRSRLEASYDPVLNPLEIRVDEE